MKSSVSYGQEIPHTDARRDCGPRDTAKLHHGATQTIEGGGAEAPLGSLFTQLINHDVVKGLDRRGGV
jgi:hypothetical protein